MGLRQVTRHKIAIANPLDVVAKFKGSSSNTDIQFSQDASQVKQVCSNGVQSGVSF